MSDRKKNVAIVGAGNAGSITALQFYTEAVHEIDKITIYHDPNTPIERVGQGSVGSASMLINNFFYLNFVDCNSIKTTRKEGIMYENWGKAKDKIFHSFPQSNTSIHYIPNLLSKAVLESGVFEVIEKNVKNPEEEIDCDFIIDCRGKDKRDPELYDPLTNPLNSVILAVKDEIIPDHYHTKTIATPNGWTFVIPNVDGTSYGYLYNKDITTKEEATADFIERFDVVPDGFLNFENYIAKNWFHGERTILNGNRLSFLEPLEASSAGFYEYVSRQAIAHIVRGVDKDLCNYYIRKEMSLTQEFILWHYQFGSKYDTPFWDYAKSLPFNPSLEFQKTLEYSMVTPYHEMVRNISRNRNPEPTIYSQWHCWSFRNWLEGMGEIVCNDKQH